MEKPFPVIQESEIVVFVNVRTRRTGMNRTVKRVIMTTLGVLVAGFGAGIFDFAQMGMDPFQVLAHGIWNKTNLSFGTLYTIVNAIMLVAVLIFDRKKIGLGTLINIFLLGYVVEYTSKLFYSLFPDASLLIRIIAIAVAVVILCFASAIYFTGDMGVSTYDAVAIYWSEKQSKIKFKYCRIITDIICTAVGFSLGAVVGVGTIITAFFMGPLIDFFKRTVAEPFLNGRSSRG